MSVRDTVAAPISRSAPSLRPGLSVKPPSDPGFAALRRSARAAIIIPLTFVFGEFVLHDTQNIIFIVFGGFALLVISNFGGQRRPRAVAYLTATLVGAALIALGTVVSQNTALAVVTMFLVGFAIALSTVFGGYVAAAQTGMLLAFLIAVSIPAPPAAVPARLAGWVFAGIVATFAAILLWPRFEQEKLRQYAAKACTAVADLVEDFRSEQDLDHLLTAARNSEQAARQAYASTAKRPAGPTRRDRALVQLLTELQQIVDIVELPFQQEGPGIRPGLDESDHLVATTVAALRSSADVLTGGAPPDLRAVEEARERHRTALDRWAGQELRGGRPSNQVLDAIDVDHTLRVISYVTIALGSNAVITAGGRPEDDIILPVSAPSLAGLSGTVTRVVRTVRTHLDPSSTVLQHSLRVGVGLALAVLLARQLGLSHSFWVMLGALQVLRTTALGTGRTTIQALVGNAIGVVIGGLVAVLLGNNQAIMWVLLPFGIFFAAYAGTTIGFIASQAAFTIVLILIFNILSPAGWQVGLVRIEDVALGAAISVVVGLLLWPSGARREFGRSVAAYYRALSNYLEQAFDRVLDFEPPASLEPVRRVALQARDRAGVAFDAFIGEKSTSPLDPQTAGRLLAAGTHGMLAAELLDFVAGRMGYHAGGCPDGARVVHSQVSVLLGNFTHFADRLDLHDGTRDEAPVATDSLRSASLDCLRRWRNDDRSGRGAMAVVIAGEWVENVARMEEGLDEPVSRAAAAEKVPWWR